jgi:hypothetical protein
MHTVLFAALPRRLYMLAHELEADAGSSSSSSSSSSHNLLPAVQAAGPITSLATYLLPEMATRVGSLVQLGLHVYYWLAGVNNLLIADDKGQDRDSQLPQPDDGVAFARLFRPSPQMVGPAPATCCAQPCQIQGISS